MKNHIAPGALYIMTFQGAAGVLKWTCDNTYLDLAAKIRESSPIFFVIIVFVIIVSKLSILLNKNHWRLTF